MDKKTEKKRAKMLERITVLETNMQISLQRKSHIGPEINLSKVQNELRELRKELALLK